MTAAAQPSEADARAAARVGQIIKGKWRIDQLLGVGGMAAVYAATHRNKKRVAIKILHSELSNDREVTTRFLQEGYAANAIEHPGAVSVLDDEVTEDGSPLLVMELLEGETLEARWERHKQSLDVGEVLGHADQLLDILAVAHDKGIVHRDIKPENLFLTREGTLKILDFGIARVLEARAAHSKKQTRSGEVMGTPAFMAPEQALARWDEVDGRTDLWATGATMFTLISGKHVHEAVTGNEQIIKAATQPAPSLSTVAPRVPAAVVAVVDRALAFRREQRWPDARVMQSEIRRVRGGAAPATRQRFASIPEMAAVPAPSKSFPSLSAMQVPSASAADLEARAHDVSELKARIAELQQRAAAARQKVTETRTRVQAMRTERANMEKSFESHAGSRASAAEDASNKVKGALAALGRAVLDDPKNFGADYSQARDEVAQLVTVASAAAKDVEIHRAALTSYDQAVWKRGVGMMLAVLVLFLVLFFMPVILRFTATD